MRIIHFSDIHASPQIGPLSSFFDKRLLGYFNYRFRRRRHMDWTLVARFVKRVKALAPDIVICTGDITTLGEPREFEVALKALAPLVEDTSFEFLYVPGNHDAYINRQASKASLHQAFRTLSRERWHLAELPLVHTVGELRFLLVNQGMPAPLWGSYGGLDAHSQRWLSSNLADALGTDSPLVLVSHFPLFDKNGIPLNWRRACRHISPLQEALKQGRIDLALCGHIHTAFQRDEPTGGTEICAGSLTQSGEFALIEYGMGSDGFQVTWMPAAEGHAGPPR